MKKVFMCIFILLLINSISGQEIIKLDQSDVELYSGHLFRVNEFQSKHVKSRNVDIWVPQDYSNKKKYSVIFMHDGGSLFGKKSTGWGSKWKADQVAAQLLDQNKVKDFIIVGIYNTAMTRWNEYFPAKSFNYLEKSFKDSLVKYYENRNDITSLIADDYLKFIVYELKPFIDKNFSVNVEAKETYISGSSMGGLISMYAIFEYPEIFSRAACISTHWVGIGRNKNGEYDKRIPFSIFNYMKNNVPSAKNHRIWFDYGDAKGDLDSYYVDYADYVDTIFSEKGYSNKNFRNIRFRGEKHNAVSWNKRLDQIFEFLLNP
ncbi:MAG: esterase [Flavobacteriaceae bacterium]|nr:esterase [Flavobacteriaceae bacterium]